MSTLKNVQILSGNFSPNGNFSAYDDDGERFFVPKRLMETQGWAVDADVKFPFWAKTKLKSIGQLDANGEALMNSDGTPVLVDRLQVASLFLTREALLQSCVDKVALDIDIQAAIRSRATTAGLDAKAIEMLANASL